MRYLFLRKNVLFMVSIKFHHPEPHWAPYDIYTKYFFFDIFTCENNMLSSRENITFAMAT